MRKIEARSLEQNRLMWQRLNDWAEQDKRYTLDGERLDAWDMKEVLMAGFLGEVRLTPDLENKRIIHISRSTSRLTKEQFTKFLAYIEAEGAKRGIVFRDTPPDEDPAILERRNAHRLARQENMAKARAAKAQRRPPMRPRPDGLPRPPHNEDELRAALKASVAATT